MFLPMLAVEQKETKKNKNKNNNNECNEYTNNEYVYTL